MNHALRITRIIGKAYLNSLLWFTIGAVCEGVVVALMLLPFIVGRH